MARISISYMAPVQVVVDLDTGKVERVVVIDEDTAYDPDGHHEDHDTHDPVTAEQITAARKIAEVVEWPPSDHGW